MRNPGFCKGEIMLRRMFRSRFLCACGASLISVIGLIMIVRVVSLVLSFADEGGQSDTLDAHHLRNPLATDFSTAVASPELVRELMRIKKSVKKELVELESRRSARLKEIESFARDLQRTKTALSRGVSEIQQMQLKIINLKARQDEVEKRNLPLLQSPLLTVDSANHVLHMDMRDLERTACTVHSCFNYHTCGLSSPAYLSIPSDASVLNTSASSSSFVVSDRSTPSVCLTIGFSASFCPKNGLNCVVIDPNGQQSLPANFVGVHASPSFLQLIYRPGFDVVMPAPALYTSGDLWSHLQPLLPARRRFLLSFVGLPPTNHAKIDQSVQSTFLDFSKRSSGDKMSVHLKCEKTVGDKVDWELCGTPKSRLELLKQSTFALVPSPSTTAGLITSTRFQRRIYESLMAGAVPVVLGDGHLPLDEIIDWQRCVIRLAKQRVTELHFLLRTIPDPDIIEMRRRGRMVMETYLGTTQYQYTSLLHLLGRRIGLAQPRASDFPAKSAFKRKIKLRTYEVENQFADIDDYLGPTDDSQDSIQFQRNFSGAWTDAHFAQFGDPFHRYPFSPWAPVLPTGGQFKQSSFGYRPIDHQQNGAGIEFSKALGGNQPYEQYTVVILTYKREQVLMSTLATFKGLPYLHSVIVVWNSPDSPREKLKWPRLQVPIHVVRGQGNSLNNRFLPFDLIKTEAILSVDDDVQLRQDEIVFGFRAWREQRHKLVGFPSRFHQWSAETKSWQYNANYTCQYSMILTGAAFFHKYYSYIYSTAMSSVIRSYVDRVKNCEDIAMNFLISHITREPPVKVTSRWTFRCPLCANSLHQDKSHYLERTVCVNFLTDVYGYNPLLYSQFRLDSVLFKTRIPADKRKCFKYV